MAEEEPMQILLSLDGPASDGLRFLPLQSAQ